MSGRRFGFECELVDGTGPTLHALERLGLVTEAALHNYHCGCDDCDPHRSHATFTAQEDCSVEGEIITRILRHGTAEADEAFAGLAEALHVGRGQPGNDAGFHVHVSHEDLTAEDRVRVLRLFMRYQDDFGEMAAQASRRVRSYNSPVQLQYLLGYRSTLTEDRFWYDDAATITDVVQQPDRCSWLAHRHATYEFRMWNSTRVEWRMRLAVGISVALVEAAKAGVNVTPRTRKSVTEVLEPFMSEDTFAALVRQSVYKEVAE